MSQHKKTTTYGGSYKGAEVHRTTTEEQSKFLYGCQWGCGRQNVCSAPGNSCGRAGCNDARSEKSWGKGFFSTHATNKK
jgi:hypothetical protein